VLAAWPPTSATFDYVTAEPNVVERTGRIAAICAKHGVPLGAAALQFVMRHPAVTTVLIGPRSVAELDQNLAAATQPVPDVLWVELRAAGLLPGGNPRAQRARASTADEGATDAH
jgi:D-threo-aldose 1-dehydrogenase